VIKDLEKFMKEKNLTTLTQLDTDHQKQKNEDACIKKINDFVTSKGFQKNLKIDFSKQFVHKKE
jgi:hypothetical protein